MRNRINERHMRNGVTIIDPDNTYIDADVRLAEIQLFIQERLLKVKQYIGKIVLLDRIQKLIDCHIGRSYSYSSICCYMIVRLVNDVQIGPFAHIRPHSDIGDEVKIGNFVEIKKTIFGKGSKASHLKLYRRCRSWKRCEYWLWFNYGEL